MIIDRTHGRGSLIASVEEVEQLARLVNDLCLAHPDAAYVPAPPPAGVFRSPCYYDAGHVRLVPEGQLPECGCIIGVALQRMGVNVVELQEAIAGRGLTSIGNILCSAADQRYRDGEDPHCLANWLTSVQVEQDAAQKLDRARETANNWHPTAAAWLAEVSA